MAKVLQLSGKPFSDGAPEQFVQFYYNTFDENRKNLAALYVR